MVLIYLMSVIGVLATLWLTFKTGKLSITFWDTMIKAGFRNKYPFDYEFNLAWVLSELRTHGYRIVKHIKIVKNIANLFSVSKFFVFCLA